MSWPRKRRGILVIQSLGLGDLLFSVPVLRVLKRTFPDEPIAFVTHHRNASLLSLVPEAENAFTYRNKNPLELARMVTRIRARRYRIAIVLNPIFRGALLAWLAGIPERVGYRRDYERTQSLFGLEKILLTNAFLPARRQMHEVDRYLGLLEEMGWLSSEQEKRPRLVLPEDALQYGRTFEAASPGSHGPLIVIHPGGSWLMKRWPLDRFAQLADGLAASYGARLFFVGEANESFLTREILQRMRQPARDLVGKTTVPQLAGLLAAADLFIGNDTGTLHLADALDVRSVSLFGPSDPGKYAPRSVHARVLYHPVPWGPCKVQYTTRCENNLCMKDIRIEEVQAAAAALLGREPSSDLKGELPHSIPTLKPKKILYLQSTSEISGTDITLLRTLELLDSTRFEPHVALHQAGPFTEEYRRAGARVHLIPAMRQLSSRRGIGHFLVCLAGYPFAAVQISRLIRREKIDLLHTNTIHNLYGFPAAWLCRTPHLWHIREVVVQSQLLRWLERMLVCRFSSRFIVMDNAIGEMFLKRGGGLPARIVKLYDGVDLEKFHPQVSGNRIRRALGLDDQTPLVGMVARLDPAKGPDLFLEIAGRVRAKIPHCRFMLCGGEIRGHEGYGSVLQRKAAVLGLENAVFFTGWKYRFEDIPEVYGALDVSLQCPRYPEPYGLAHIEAMASGVPIVAFAQGGPTELCVDNQTARLVPPGDVAAATEAVANLVMDSAGARAMGEAGRKRAEMMFDRRRCVKELEKLYESILDGSPSC